MKKILTMIAIALIVQGVTAGALGTWLAGRAVHGLVFDAGAQGEIVGREAFVGLTKHGGKRHLSKPVVAFTANDGRRYQFTDSVTITSDPVHGKQVRIWYPPDQPQQAYIAKGRWLGSMLGLVLLLGGGLCVLLGAGFGLFVRFAKWSK